MAADLAKTYDFSSRDKTPTIDGVEVPWFIPHGATPRVEAVPDSAVPHHILWIPICVEGEIPEYGAPDAPELEVTDG
jgi:hypothetical protein